MEYSFTLITVATSSESLLGVDLFLPALVLFTFVQT